MSGEEPTSDCFNWSDVGLICLDTIEITLSDGSKAEVPIDSEIAKDYLNRQ